MPTALGRNLMVRLWLIPASFWLCCLGCQSLAPPGLRSSTDSARSAQSPQALREEGQKAMRDGDASRAIYLFVYSLSLEERWPHNRLLTSAATHLSRGENDAACADLGQFLETHPQHGNARFCLAELLLRLDQLPEARRQYEQLIDRCADTLPEDEHLLLHCHGRLTVLAEAINDPFPAHLHRGIGLYLLAISKMPPGADDPDVSNESLLCRAMTELLEAQELKPGEAQPCWYLYAVYQKLGQQHLARRWLRAAQRVAPFTHLSAAEQRDLELAFGALTERRLGR